MKFSGCCDRRLPYNSCVHFHLNYYTYITQSSNFVQNTFWQSGSDSRWFLNNYFSKYLNGTRDPPHMEKSILNFHYDYWNPSLKTLQELRMLFCRTLLIDKRHSIQNFQNVPNCCNKGQLSYHSVKDNVNHYAVPLDHQNDGRGHKTRSQAISIVLLPYLGIPE